MRITKNIIKTERHHLMTRLSQKKAKKESGLTPENSDNLNKILTQVDSFNKKKLTKSQERSLELLAIYTLNIRYIIPPLNIKEETKDRLSKIKGINKLSKHQNYHILEIAFILHSLLGAKNLSWQQKQSVENILLLLTQIQQNS